MRSTPLRVEDAKERRPTKKAATAPVCNHTRQCVTCWSRANKPHRKDRRAYAIRAHTHMTCRCKRSLLQSAPRQPRSYGERNKQLSGLCMYHRCLESNKPLRYPPYFIQLRPASVCFFQDFLVPYGISLIKSNSITGTNAS